MTEVWAGMAELEGGGDGTERALAALFWGLPSVKAGGWYPAGRAEEFSGRDAREPGCELPARLAAALWASDTDESETDGEVGLDGQD